jgi:hypothetical protein
MSERENRAFFVLYRFRVHCRSPFSLFLKSLLRGFTGLTGKQQATTARQEIILLSVRTTSATVPFHHLPIDAPPWKTALPGVCIILFTGVTNELFEVWGGNQ